MFRILPSASRSALLLSPNAFCLARLFHATPDAAGRPRLDKKFESAQLSQIPNSVEGLSKHLHDVYGSAGSRKRAQADNKRVNVVSKELCGWFSVPNEDIHLTVYR